MENKDYKYLGDLSAVEPVYSRRMACHGCEVEWQGCWDNFMCPKCGKGELPKDDFVELPKMKVSNEK